MLSLPTGKREGLCENYPGIVAWHDRSFEDVEADNIDLALSPLAAPSPLETERLSVSNANSRHDDLKISATSALLRSGTQFHEEKKTRQNTLSSD
jgi:hypothetical protein